MRAYTFAFALLLVASCTDLPGIASGRCGNGVLDPDEDCDSSAANCVVCRRTCDRTIDENDETVENQSKICTPLGAGYRCGADNFCHAPSGVFRQVESASFPFVVGQGLAADLDADGIGDIIGFGDVNIDVRFGALDAQFTSRASTQLPYGNGNFAIRTLPRSSPTDPSHDVLLPTPDGVIAFHAPHASKTLVPFPFANNPGKKTECATKIGGSLWSGMGPPPGFPVKFFPIDKHHMGVIVRVNEGPSKKTTPAYLSVMDIEDPTKCPSVPLCGLAVTDPSDPTLMPMEQATLLFVDSYTVSTAPQLSTVIAVITPDARGAMTGKTCVVRYDEAAASTTTLTTSPVPGSLAPIALARATPGAVCPTLFSMGDANDAVPFGLQYLMGSATAPCTLNTTSPPILARSSGGAHAGVVPAGRIPLAPAIANRAPDALALVTPSTFSGTTEVLALGGTTSVVTYDNLFTSSRGLYPILSGDLDGNALTIEAVAPAYSAGTNPQRDFEVLVRSPNPDLGFLPYRLVTHSAPTQFAVGDFDGNAITDLAYAETMGTRERVMVSYGTRDRLLEPVEIASFRGIASMLPIDVRDSIEPTGTVLDDLAIVEKDADELGMGPSMGGGPPPLVILHGNPQRSMLAYYDPRDPFRIEQSELTLAFAGNFDPTNDIPARDGAPSQVVADLIAFERQITDFNTTDSTTVDSISLWLARGSKGQGLEPTASAAATPFVAGARCMQEDRLCATTTEVIAWPSDDGGDVLIALDSNFMGPRHIVTIDPYPFPTSTVSPVTTRPSPVTDLPTGLEVFAMYPAHLSGDANPPQLAIVLADFMTGMRTVTMICNVSANGLVESCGNLTDLVPELSTAEGGDAWVCGGGGPATVAPWLRAEQADDAARHNDQILVHCKRGAEGIVVRVYHEDDQIRAKAVFRGAGGWQFMAVGDVNGDQLTDIVGIAFDFMTFIPQLHIHLQCGARDTDCTDDATKTLEQSGGTVPNGEPLP